MCTLTHLVCTVTHPHRLGVHVYFHTHTRIGCRLGVHTHTMRETRERQKIRGAVGKECAHSHTQRDREAEAPWEEKAKPKAVRRSMGGLWVVNLSRLLFERSTSLFLCVPVCLRACVRRCPGVPVRLLLSAPLRLSGLPSGSAPLVGPCAIHVPGLLWCASASYVPRSRMCLGFSGSTLPHPMEASPLCPIKGREKSRNLPLRSEP